MSKTILWNGPAGYFENINFSKGTTHIAEKISKNTNTTSLISIVGGGDTIAALKKNKLNLNFTHLSTAGGAFLEYIEGKKLAWNRSFKININNENRRYSKKNVC